MSKHSYNMIDLKDVTEDLNTVGKGFCLAKWYHVSMHLHTGQNHSCYHPAPHKIPLDLAKEDAMFFTIVRLRNKLERKCWKAEDLMSVLIVGMLKI